MTNEEAMKQIKVIKVFMGYDKDNPIVQKAQEALDMAIEALEQQPCEDCISRQAVIDSIKDYFHDEYYQRTSIQDCRDCLIEDVITKLPSVTPQPITLEKAIDYLHEIGWMQEHDKEMAQLNGKVEQEPKAGEWLKNGELCKCSRCGSNVLFSAVKAYNFCYRCGAKMEVRE